MIKKMSAGLVMVLAFAVLLGGNTVKAQSSTGEVDSTYSYKAEVKPVGFFDKVKLVFTFNSEKKAKLLSEFSERNFELAKEKISEGKTEEANDFFLKSDEDIKKATESISKIEDESKQEEALNSIGATASNRMIVLTEVKEKVGNENAKEAIQKALDKQGEVKSSADEKISALFKVIAELEAKIKELEQKNDVKEEDKKDKEEVKSDSKDDSFDEKKKEEEKKKVYNTSTTATGVKPTLTSTTYPKYDSSSSSDDDKYDDKNDSSYDDDKNDNDDSKDEDDKDSSDDGDDSKDDDKDDDDKNDSNKGSGSDDEKGLTPANVPFKILSPNGGEVLTRGQEVVIKWQGGPASSGVGIALIKQTPYQVDSIIVGNTPGTSNDGVYIWKIPSNIAPGKYSLNAGNNNDGFWDYSDQIFTIK